ncbi:MAG: formylmethanofuran dehydrogenase subunit A [Promethearchaeota archaeon]
MAVTGTVVVKNAWLVDPANGVDGEVVDVAIKDGRVVEDVSSPDVTIDAAGQLTVPCGVDPNCHIFSSTLAGANLFGGPPLELVAGTYVRLGYSTIVDPTIPPSAVPLAETWARGLPLDFGWLVDFGSSWWLAAEVREGDSQRLAQKISQVLREGFALGVSAHVPFDTEWWEPTAGRRGAEYLLDSRVPHFDFTPRQVCSVLAAAVKLLGTAHPLHLTPPHPESAAGPGVAIGAVGAALEGARRTGGPGPALHWPSLAAFATSEDERGEVALRSKELAKFVGDNGDLEFDLGACAFHGPVGVGTRNKYAERHLKPGTPKLRRSWEAEVEYLAGVRAVRESRPLDVARWAAGLELALSCPLDRLSFSVNHPNLGTVWDVPSLMALLASAPYRAEIMDRVGRLLPHDATLPATDRELTISELVTITRSNPARGYGLVEKGHLGPGAEGSLAVFPLRPDHVDPSTEFELIERALRAARVVLLAGRVAFDPSKGGLTWRRPGRVFFTRGDPRLSVPPHVASATERFVQKFGSTTQGWTGAKPRTTDVEVNARRAT